MCPIAQTNAIFPLHLCPFRVHRAGRAANDTCRKPCSSHDRSHGGGAAPQPVARALPIMTMEFHPLANCFPLIEGPQFDALVKDISEKGQITSIVQFQNKILDGRNRYRACNKLGIKPRITEYEGDDPVGYIISLNIARRHLNSSQRALVAARIANLANGSNQFKTKAKNEGRSNDLPCTIKEAAKLMNVGTSTAFRAGVVLKSATTQNIEEIEAGHKTINHVWRIANGAAVLPAKLKGYSAKKASRFVDTIKTICDTCSGLQSIPIPSLKAEEIASVNKEIKEARRLLLDLKKHLEEMPCQN